MNSKTHGRPVIVVGGGIGGMAAALGLSQLGLRVTILEQTAEIGEKLSIRRFTKYVLGEGLQKRQDDFAAEVAAQVAAK